MKWAIFYDDCRVVTDEQADFSEVPAVGVQVIAVEDHDCGRSLIQSFDYYWWDCGLWFGGDKIGLVDYIMRTKTQKILFGRVVPTEQFKAIYQLAVDHPYLPRKSAWNKGERV